MAKAKPLPSAEILRAAFDYDPRTGILSWKEGARLAGKIAGHLEAKGKRYRCMTVMLDYQSYKVHRVVWKIMTGQEPPDEIDHEDGDPSNNRWINLRDGTGGVNHMNVATSSRSKTNVRGVYPAKNGKSWCAAIYLKRKRSYLGTFSSIEEAEQAVLEARKGLGFGPRHGASLAS